MRHFIRNHRLGLVVVMLSLVAVSRVFSQRQTPAPASETIAFRIIVVESEEAAKRILEQLTQGENFVALANRPRLPLGGANR